MKVTGAVRERVLLNATLKLHRYLKKEWDAQVRLLIGAEYGQ